jgi:dTDP-4-amino-4,6-dideoxygalactose transaminase
MGTFGDLAAFSFYPTKNLGAFGDAGMVVTPSADLAEKVRRLREYGWGPGRLSTMPGVNARLDELQAAILRIRLADLPADNRRRVEIAGAYDAALRGSALALPARADGAGHVYHQYVCRTPSREALREHLRARGIETAVHYPRPVHLEPGYAGRILHHGLEVTERLAKEVLSLPMHPWLGDMDVARVTREATAFRPTAP